MESSSMAAIVLDAPGPPEALRIRELPIPVPAPGQVLIRVKAFGLNRSELHTRLGLAEGVTFRGCWASRRPAWSLRRPVASSRSSSTRSPRARPSCRSTAPTASTRSPRHTRTWRRHRHRQVRRPDQPGSKQRPLTAIRRAVRPCLVCGVAVRLGDPVGGPGTQRRPPVPSGWPPLVSHCSRCGGVRLGDRRHVLWDHSCGGSPFVRVSSFISSPMFLAVRGSWKVCTSSMSPVK